jgi:hypothetical protein
VLSYYLSRETDCWRAIGAAVEPIYPRAAILGSKVLPAKIVNPNMKKNITPHKLLTALIAAVTGVLLMVPSSFGQTITNPSFEANVFTVAPGSISANTAITGWTAADNTKAGLSPAGGLNTFANNGTIPNGTNVLYVQTTNVVSTVISGLTPGLNYTVRFRANSQNATIPTLRVSLDGQNLLDVGSIISVGGVLPYKFVSLNFAATAASHTLYLTNDAVPVTAVLLVDDFSVALSTSGWSISAWTNDASSGIDSSKNYTHAYAFNVTGTNIPVNGVPFTRLGPVANPQVAYELQTANFSQVATDSGNVLRTAAGGSSSNLAFGFVYNGNPEIINLQNLVPGVEYLTTIYSVGWDPRAYGRAVTWRVGNDMLSVNEDQFGDAVGIRVSYRFIAPATGYLTISNFPFSTAVGTFHVFALANYEVNPQSGPVIGIQPVSKASIPGGGAGFYVTAGGARPLTYQWLKDGAPISNQTNRWLNLNNLTAADIAQYSVAVSNSFSVVTSSSAGLTFSTATIPNPSFEEDTYFNYPGYTSGNFPITGWISSRPAGTGINPAADVLNPFANNGIIPDGRNAAFLQSTSSLSTIISGLVSNQNYFLKFRANGRQTYRPNLVISINGQSILDTVFNNVSAAGSNDYREVVVPFTAPNTNALLTLSCLTNYYAGDHAVAVDNFSIAPSNSMWSYSIWTNDATSGVDPSKLHTHAFHFGAVGTNTIINNTEFRFVGGANPSVPGSFAVSGMPTAFTGADANVFNVTGGGSAGMSSQFIYNGPLQTITLFNLVPGNEYVASIFSVGWDPKTYGRAATFFVGNDKLTINQDAFGSDQGIVINYRYLAPSNGTMTLSYVPTDSGSSIHTYAFANRVATDSQPIIGAQPQSTFVAIGATQTLFVGLSAGSLPLSYQWRSNGVDIADATNTTLVLGNLNSYGASGYTVVVSNFLGSVTSAVANVEVGIKLSEVFNTGVDETNQWLSGGQIDSHYRLVSSPDPFFPGPDALVMHNGAFPLLANYFTNGLFSSWISPRTNSSPGNSNGYYFYRTAFIIDTADPAHAQINGKWASDNEGIDIRLNGVSLGISNNVSAAFTGFVPFTITNGFIAGSNTIDFVISNGPATGPTALRVEMAGAGRPLAPAAPQIVNQPTGGTVLKNSAVALSVLAIGSGPLSYQWFFEGSPMTDETNRVLRFPSIQIAQSGNYSVTITNDQGTTNSAIANLNVVAAPLVLVGPDSVTVNCSEETSFVVEYEGSQPITFQWYFRGNPMPGETGDFVVVPNVHPAQTGAYFVVLTGPGGSYTSSVATLTLNDFVAPVIHGGTNRLACTASNSAPVTFAVTATDDCDPNPNLVCTPASGSVFPLGTNTVTCVATDANGNATTNTFTVTVFKAAQPTATNVNRSGTTVTFGFQTENGCSYRVEKSDSLSPPSWSFLENIVGDGTVKIATDPDATVPMRFYRIVVQ